MKVCPENEHVKEERGAGGGAGREGGKTPRLPPQRAAALSRGYQRRRVQRRGLPEPRSGAAPGRPHGAGATAGSLRRYPARGFPSALAPLPHALANDYISQHFPLPSGLCGEPRRLSPSPRLAGGSARRRGGARSPGPAAPPAVQARSRRRSERAGRRAAPCGLPPASSAWPSAP